MSNDPEMTKKLLEIFKEELAEQLQSITNNLLKLEKNNLSNEETDKIIESIFRSAHNIKGAARGVGVLDVGNIAHHVESLFSAMKNKTISCSSPIIDLCLESIDNMRSAMDSFTNHTPLSFDLNDILSRLSQGIKNIPVESKIKHNAQTNDKKVYESSHKNPTTKEYETIRVSVKSLDRVSSLVEEMQVNKISIEDHYATILKLNNKSKQADYFWKQLGYSISSNELNDHTKKLYHSSSSTFLDTFALVAEIEKSMKKSINELSVLSESIQDELRTLRLLPASILLDSLPRFTRDISNNLGKSVELVITGDAVKMDKLILEGLQNPLIHLLRNAIDHGIESPEIRTKLGKPEIGKIHINVKDEGDHIIISISDDGMGIDVKKIASIAENKNMFNKAILDGMSEKALIDLIFSSGFSTKEIITDVSGRGIGLDVVKSNITNLKGDLSVETKVGVGTTFYLKLPLTLASERGLIVKCENQSFVIPTNIIERIVLLKPNDIVELEASQAIVLDKHAIPLKSLADILGMTNKDFNIQENIPILILKNASHSIALLVHEIIGEREIVVKPLNPPLSHIPLVSGGTLDGNGQAILVLNSNDLITTALNLGVRSRIIPQNTSEKSKKRIQILVVDDSITTRTLEKNILESKDYEVTVAVNGKEAWDLLQKQKFALLITDVNMPIMDGFALTENVKKSQTLCDLPVIIVTSLENDSEKKRGIEVGANAYLVKSQFESQALLEIVEQLV